MKTRIVLRGFCSLLCCFVGLFLISCSREKAQPFSDLYQETEISAACLTEKEAIAQALNIYRELFSESLRTADNLEVLNVQKTSPFRSSSESEDNLGVFVVNFKDNRGYVVLSESKYNEPIITVTDRGNLDVSVSTENMNLIPVLYNTDAILEYNHKNPMITDLVDPDGTPIPNRAELEYCEFSFSPWKTLEQAGPLVSVSWGQSYPHNRKLQQINGLFPPVGCVATAVSQIMSYHRYPEYNWDKIISDSSDVYSVDILSTLHRDLGKPENLNMRYSLSGSGANSANVPRTFRAYGYESSELCDYNWETIWSEINTQRPVYIRANSFQHVSKTPRFLFWGGKTKISYSGGHAWVLDGVKKLMREVTRHDRRTNEVLEVSYQIKELVHCNFGWDGRDNGYYLSKAFNTVRGREMRSSVNSDVTYGQEGNYQYNHQIIKDIRRK